jgi:hypothetical protein
VGEMEIQVSEAIIAEAAHFPLIGEKWSKNFPVKDIPWAEFLVSTKTKHNMKDIPIFQVNVITPRNSLGL